MELKEEAIRLTARVLPDEWNERRLGDLIDLMPSGIYGAETAGQGLIGCPVATTAHIDSDDKWNEKDMNIRFFTREQLGRYMPVAGDLIVVKSSGSAEKIQSGKIGFVDRSKEQAFVFSNFLMLLRPKQVDPLFLFFYLCSHSVKKELPNLVEASTYPNIRIDDYLALPIPVPPLPEQRAIATALSDVDGSLAGLDALIAKKKALKQGAMQQLLTGKQRLPGFKGEWVVRRLGDLASLYQSQTIAQNRFTKQGYPVYGANGVIGYYDQFNHATPQVTISCRGNCGTVNITTGHAWITGNAMVVNCDSNKKLNKLFLFQLLSVQDFSILVASSAQPQIVRGPLAAYELYLPIEQEEQTAIAEVLSDMDAELGALEARRAKTALLKQGMMQELLTGRVRLV